MLVAVAAACSSPPVRTVPHEHAARTDLPGGVPDTATTGSRARREPLSPVVDRAPQPPPVEIPRYDERPADQVWIPGYWRWDVDLLDFVWVPGGWMLPPRERAWIAPRWVETGDGRYRFLPGYWR